MVPTVFHQVESAIEVIVGFGFVPRTIPEVSTFLFLFDVAHVANESVCPTSQQTDNKQQELQVVQLINGPHPIATGVTKPFSYYS